MGAKQRCFNAKTERYKSYGGRGITMCDRWRADFVNFYADMGPCPEGYSLERLDPDGNYEPGNCAWIPKADQAKNKSRKWIVHGADRSADIHVWAAELGVPMRAVSFLLRHGLNIDEIKTFETLRLGRSAGGKTESVDCISAL